MAENNDALEKTEQDTSTRLLSMCKKGPLARSRELNTVLVMLAGTSALILIGKGIMEDLAGIVSKSLTIQREALFNDNTLPDTFYSTITDVFLLLLPFLVLMVIVAALAPLLLSGWTFSMPAIGFKWRKLNPVTGMGRIFAWNGVAELLKALAKFTLVLFAVSIFLWQKQDDFLLLSKQSAEVALAHAASNIIWAFLFISLVLIIVALVDVPFQLWDHHNQRRITKLGARNETRESDGNPDEQGRERQMQREILKRRMMENVSTADIIVTNPTHYAVAIKYDKGSMNVPVVVAKGSGLIAQQIRNAGSINDVPVVSVPPLARSLYFSVKLDQKIPDGLFPAVAQLFAYVYQLNAMQVSNSKIPDVPDFPVPDDLRRDASL